MEDTLGDHEVWWTDLYSSVLILVLMEDTLGVLEVAAERAAGGFLILVLMEDTLGAKELDEYLQYNTLS